MIKKILVPLDSSKSSDNALDLALDLAEKYSAEVLLLSVVPTTVYPSFTAPAAYPFLSVPSAIPYGSVPPSVIESSTRELEAKFEGVLSEALKKAEKMRPRLNVSAKLDTGRPAEKIVQTAENGNFDLIVMGSRGLSGVKKLMFGSVSARVADKATCPVVIVK